MKKFTAFFAAVFCALAINANAQTTSVLTGGLENPTKIITAPGNSLLVAEAGTTVPNSGRISIVNRATGARQTLVDGLPSGVNNLGGQPETTGPSGLVLRGNTLYLSISVGDAVQNTGGPGIESPNPNPSSPLYDAVLELDLPGGFHNLTSGYTLTTAQQAQIAGGAIVTLSNGSRKTLRIRLVADLPNFVPNPRPGLPNNVRSSNLYGVEIFQKSLYVADASRNLIHEINIASGEFSTFATFPNKPNPLFPTLGGPFIEPVPDNIHRVGNRLLVPLLTGFPFVAGLSEIQSVSLKNGERETFIPNLTSAIDVLHVEDEMYYTLEFSASMLGGQPGRLRFFASPEDAPVTIAANLISPTSMTRDEQTGDIFITEIFTGRIMRVSEF